MTTRSLPLPELYRRLVSNFSPNPFLVPDIRLLNLLSWVGGVSPPGCRPTYRTVYLVPDLTSGEPTSEIRHVFDGLTPLMWETPGELTWKRRVRCSTGLRLNVSFPSESAETVYESSTGTIRNHPVLPIHI